MRVKLVMVIAICLVLTLGAGATALAAESWATDPATGGKIGWVSEGSTLAAAKWTGPLADGKAEGKGSLAVTIRDQDGKELKGTADAEMKAGKLDGKIVITWSDGDFYDGFYKEGLRDGKGVYRFADGRSYDGEWKAGKQSGKGVFRWANGTIYEGDWQNGKMDGKGTQKYPDGSSYDGDWKGVREGKGVFRWPNGEVYEGEFHNDSMEGKGVYKYSSGQVYVGDFVNGQRHGQGVMRDAAGKVMYEGEWRNHEPANQPAPDSGRLTGFLGITWGTAREEAEKLIMARPNTRKLFNDDTITHFSGSFNDMPAVLSLEYYGGKLIQGCAWLPVDEDGVVALFDRMKAQMTDKYGKAAKESGKYLDSEVQWAFPAAGADDSIVIRFAKTDFFAKDQSLSADRRKPFAVWISYYYGAGQVQKIQQQKKSSGKDL